MTRILLVDDQALVRSGFATILGTEPGFEVVGQAEDGAKGVKLAAELDPDVICMDVQMPVMDGLEATRAICSGPSQASVLMITTFDRDDFLFSALEAGASGFLLKTAEAEHLIEAVRALARGDALLSPEVTRRVIERFAMPGAASDPVQVSSPDRLPGPGLPSSGRVSALGPAAVKQLTDRELETLMRLARGRSNAEIAAELYLGEATVKTHVSNVLMKLGVRDRIHAVIWAYEHALVTPRA